MAGPVAAAQAHSAPSAGASSDTLNCTIKPSSAANAEPITTSTAIGAEDKDPFISFIESTALSAGEATATDGAGWVFNLLLGNKGDKNQTDPELEKELQQQRGQLDSIQGQIQGLSNQLTNAEFAIKSQLVDLDFDTQVAVDNATISKIQTMVQSLCEMDARTATNTTEKPFAPDADDISTITEIRTQMSNYLQSMSNALLGTTGGKGIISIYRQALWNHATVSASTPPSQAIWTADFLNSMHSLIDYYVGLAGQAFNTYAEAIHWASVANPDKGVPALGAADSQKITQLYAQLRLNIMAWTSAATDDLPTIPKDTAVDIRTNTAGTGTYQMWTAEPVAIPHTAAPYYCIRQASLCLYNEWDPAANDTSVAAARIVPYVTALQSALSLTTNGFHDWRLPTRKDWTTLVTPSYTGTGADKKLVGVDPNNGVGIWATAEHLGVLSPDTVDGPLGEVNTIPPVVVNDPTAQVLTFNDPKSAAPTAPGSETSVALAGRLALVRSISAVPPALPAQPTLHAPTPAPATRTPTTSPGTFKSLTRTTVPHGAVLGTANTSSAFQGASDSCTAGYVQPYGVNAIQVTVIGAAGGSGGPGSAGGQGAQVTAVIPLAPGGVVYSRVGGQGGNSVYKETNPLTLIPGAGGVGGGAAGGPAGGSMWPGGGGGGLSGISADGGCQQWLAVAGGGGGGGGIFTTYSHTTGVNGGNACQTSGCAGGTGTLNGQPANDQGAGIGGDLIKGGGGGQHVGKTAASGANGMRAHGGIGGLGGIVATSIHVWGGGSGGGGGAGLAGGGGGGGSTGGYSGGGGGGGSSYVIPGAISSAYSVSAAGTSPQVVITPILVADYEIGTDPGTAALPSVLQVDSTNKTVRRADELAANVNWQGWGLEPVGNDSVNTYFLLHNVGAGSCLANDRTNGHALTVAACDGNNPNQAWKFVWQPNGALTVQTEWGGGANLPLVLAATPNGPASLAELAADLPAQQWSLLPVTGGRPIPTINLQATKTNQVTDPNQLLPITATLPVDATGTVSFITVSGETVVGTATIDHGVATLTAFTSPLTTKQNVFQATYPGDRKYAASSSNWVIIFYKTATLGSAGPATPTTHNAVRGSADDNNLASTGAGHTLPLTVTGILLIILGGATISVTRRRRRRRPTHLG